MDREEMLKIAATTGGGFMHKPKVTRIETREPEVIHVGKRNKHVGYQVIVPERIGPEPSLPSEIGPTYINRVYVSNDYYASIWISERVDMVEGGVHQVFINDYGHWRAYIMPVWMLQEDYDREQREARAKEPPMTDEEAQQAIEDALRED